MTFLTERLAELRKHLDHLYEIRGKVTAPEALERDLTLHNDVLFSLLTVVRLVIDISGELSTRQGLSFSDYTGAVRNLKQQPAFPSELVDDLSRLPGFRNVLLHDYVELDYQIVMRALNELEPVETFLRIVAELEERATPS